MLVSYNGLFKQLIDRGWNKTEFARRKEAFDTFFADYEGIQYLPFSAVDGRGVETLREILASVTEDA